MDLDRSSLAMREGLLYQPGGQALVLMSRFACHRQGGHGASGLLIML